jgi:hypothetical protein
MLEYIFNGTNYSRILFNGTNFCRVLLYTPLILMGSIFGSIIYDYVTYEEEEEDEDEVKKND